MKKSNKTTMILFIIYCIILIWLILFKFSYNISELQRIRNINLLPFYYDYEVISHFKEVIYNVLVFIPFAIYLMMLNNNYKKCILIGFLFSLLMETLQYILYIGSSDITDLITNILGIMIGVFIYLVLSKILKNPNKILNIIALIFTLLFLMLNVILIVYNVS